METIRQLGSSARAHGIQSAMKPVWDGSFSGHPHKIEAFVKETIRDYKKSFTFLLPAIYLLVCRSWWTRLWVIQEITLGKNVVVTCGNRTISWLDFCATFSLFDLFLDIGRTSNILSPDLVTLLIGISSRVISNIQVWSGFKQRGSKGLSLLAALSSTCFGKYTQSTDPRDRVFGLFGMLDEPDKAEITVDYSKSGRNIFSEATVALLKYHGPDIFDYCERHSPVGIALPSWVPDWTGRTGFPLHSRMIGLYSASVQLSMESIVMTHYPATGILSLPGFLVDVIHKLGPAYRSRVTDNAEKHAKSIAHWTKEMKDLLSSSNNIAYHCLSQIEEALWRTPITDTIGVARVRRAQPHDKRGYTILLEVAGLAKEENEGLLQARLAGSHVYRTSLDVIQRRAFVSSRGHIGLGPKTARPNDVICIFAGGQTPSILRPTDGGRYQLIGEAYVHGIMDGESIDQTMIPQTIELC